MHVSQHTIPNLAMLAHDGMKYEGPEHVSRGSIVLKGTMCIKVQRSLGAV